MKRLHGDGGFTLIELLVCVAVIALVAALAIPRAYAAVTTTRRNHAQVELSRIAGALFRHYLDHGFYPRKLNDLVDRGYLPPRTSFRSPSSGYWYFYAIDDNRPGEKARAFVLGAPGSDAGDDDKLYHSRPLPRGRRPDWGAYAWKHFLGYNGSLGLNLYADNDTGDPIDEGVPDDLSTYRDVCKPSSPGPCDVYTN